MLKGQKLWGRLVATLLVLYLAALTPMIRQQTSRENVAERQAQDAGMVRMYCEDSSRHPLKSPNIPFGKRAFNLEFSIFEWAEGRIAALVDGPKCDSVEVIGRVVSIAWSALAIVLVFAIGAELLSPVAGAIAAFCLATDFMWLKFGSFILVDNRMLACGLLAYFLSLRASWVISAVFWFLCLSQKPQAFAFVGPYFVTLEVVRYWLNREKEPFLNSERLKGAATLAIGVAFGLAYYAYSVKVNERGDLPWLAWTGPRSQKWFFGDWAERFQWDFYKSLLLDWVKKSGLVFALPFIAITAAMNKSALKKFYLPLVLLTLPFLAGRFLNVFVFLNVFKVHDYYALPLNVFAALTKGLVFGSLFQVLRETRALKNTWKWAFALPALIGALTYPAIKNTRQYYRFARDSRDPSSEIYQFEWNKIKLFPKAKAFVVVAQASRGRDYTYLYLSKHSGHIWCAYNKEFAPRAFWKAEGVEYVAWQDGVDLKTRLPTFTVRSIDDELALARRNGWSSDVNDVWAGHTMAEWARIASHTFHDPCVAGQEDPRRWPKL